MMKRADRNLARCGKPLHLMEQINETACKAEGDQKTAGHSRQRQRGLNQTDRQHQIRQPEVAEGMRFHRRIIHGSSKTIPKLSDLNLPVKCSGDCLNLGRTICVKGFTFENRSLRQVLEGLNTL